MKRWAYPALAFLTGSAVTIFEFAAPNLFRAYFGQTIFVWANVIGVILLALAIGYFVGGRWADRTRTAAPLFGILLAAGLYGLLVGWFGPAVSLWLAGPEEYTQDTALPAFLWESLAASVLLFGPPILLLGMATPILVQRAASSWPVGSAAGGVFAVSTAGSIAGIYLTTFVLLDLLGVRWTILFGAGMLCLLSGLGFLRLRLRRRAAAALVAALGSLFGGGAPWDRLPPAGSRLVLAIESPYQLIRVVDREGPEGGRARWLAFDEGMGTYHSMMLPEGARETGAYYDAFGTLPSWIGGGGPADVCIVGNAAGTMVDLLHALHGPELLRIDAVEIDPRVSEAARASMGFRAEEIPGLRLVHGDGRTFLASRPEGCYDAILLDAYARQVSIPPGLATREFFALARSRLREGGLLLVNLGALRAGGALVRTLGETIAAAFGTPVFRAPLDGQTNVLLVAARGGAPPPPPATTPLGAPQSFGLHPPGSGEVMTDDRCPVELLTARDLRSGAFPIFQSPPADGEPEAVTAARAIQRNEGHHAAAAHLASRLADWKTADAFARLCFWAGEEEAGLLALERSSLPRGQKDWATADLLCSLGRFGEAVERGRAAGKSAEWLSWVAGQSELRQRLRSRGARGAAVAAGGLLLVAGLGALLRRFAPRG